MHQQYAYSVYETVRIIGYARNQRIPAAYNSTRPLLENANGLAEGISSTKLPLNS